MIAFANTPKTAQKALHGTQPGEWLPYPYPPVKITLSPKIPELAIYKITGTS